MSKIKVYVTRGIPENGLKLLREKFDVEVWEKYAPPPREVLIDKVRNVDAIISLLSDKIDKKILDAAPKLKIIAQFAVGFDNIDLATATKKGICVTNTPDVLTETSADFAWTLLMAIARRVVEADKYVKSGNWKVAWHPNMILGADIYGSTLGIIGAGRIGYAVARRAKGFSMKILYSSTSTNTFMEQDLGAKRVDLDLLLTKSDFVSLHVPLNKFTRNMIDEDKLKLMKKTACLINNSRGAVIDEKALCHALKEKWIAGAGLDVFQIEPTSVDNPLLKFNNVIVAPHISSGSHKTRNNMANMVAENIIDFFNGKIPPNLVNKEVLNLK